MPAAMTLIGSQSQAASLTKTDQEIAAGTAALLGLTRVRVSQSTHKTSEQYTLKGQRITTTGTGTATTPLVNETQSAALGAARIGGCKTVDTVEPTYTASTVSINANVNSLTGRDIPYPPGSEIWIAPAAILGLAVVTPAATTTATYDVESAFFALG